jgi:hypothetical protein
LIRADTEDRSAPPDKGDRQPVQLLLRVPRHHVFAMIHYMEVKARLHFLEQLGPLCRVRAIVAPIDEEYRHFEVSISSTSTWKPVHLVALFEFDKNSGRQVD